MDNFWERVRLFKLYYGPRTHWTLRIFLSGVLPSVSLGGVLFDRFSSK